ncbi:Ser/Thr protein kinase OS=Streptomyces glaucescens OX=1907 GN=SGLAU_19040 PE=4 SV=1 [Streptomyces glaucescens]
MDAATGENRWTERIPGHAVPSFATFPGDPLAYAAGPSDDGSGTRVSAVDPTTGEVRWTAVLEGTVKPVGVGTGAIRPVYFAAVDPGYGDMDAVVRYEPGSRTVDRVALPVPRQDAQAAVHGDVVYVLGAGGSLEAFDLARGKRLWHLETAVSRGSTPVADGRHVYFTAADGGSSAWAPGRGQARSGRPRPRLGPDSDKVRRVPCPRPLLAGTHVYAGAPDGTVFGVAGRDPAPGEAPAGRRCHPPLSPPYASGPPPPSPSYGRAAVPQGDGRSVYAGRAVSPAC